MSRVVRAAALLATALVAALTVAGTIPPVVGAAVPVLVVLALVMRPAAPVAAPVTAPAPVRLPAPATDRHARRLAALVEQGPDVVAVLDADGTVAFVSEAATRTLGVHPPELVGAPLAALLDESASAVVTELVALQEPGSADAVRLLLARPEGDLALVGTLTNRLTDPAVRGLVLVLREATDGVDGDQRALVDPQTGLATRRLFLDRLGHALSARADRASSAAVLVVELEDHDALADRLGREATARLLAEVGRRLHQAVRTADTAARLGVDEFGLLLEATSLDVARQVAGRVLAGLAAPVDVGHPGGDVVLRAVVGLTAAVPGEIGAQDAVRDAAVAVRWAHGRLEPAARFDSPDRVAVHDSVLHAEAVERLRLRAELQRAVRGGELRLHHQPVVDVATEEVVGFEALVRWQHPEKGLLPPAEFVPMAEETQMIGALGRWVLEEACRFAATLPPTRGAARGPWISVNVSGQQLVHPGFTDEVIEVLTQARLVPERLVLEVAESTLLTDVEPVSQRLAVLRRVGVRVAIDDFGTGYGSLAHLAHLPVDVLKVDRAFVARLASDPQSAAVTRAILAMSSSLHLETVAEGVEDAAQLHWLRRTSCTLAQGFLWSPAVPAAEARPLLDAPRRVHVSDPV